MKEPNIYKPEFIPYYPAIADRYGLNPVEALIYGFIRFYTSSTNNAFYFSNEQIGKIVGRHEVNISKAITKLLKVGVLEAEYEVKASGGTVRFLKARLNEIAKSGLTKSLSQTKRNRLPNNNKINDNKVNKKTEEASASVVNDIVDKKGITSIGDLIKGKVFKPPSGDNHVFTPWQDHALRVAEKLNIKPDSAWFRCFKTYYTRKEVGKLENAYSRTIDAGARDTRKYFFWAVAN